MNTVFVCSNESCRVVWSADPQGHCPACKKADGGGWSTISSDVRSLPKPASRDLIDYGYAPGSYSSHCLTCDRQMDFVDKRCRCCKPCAEAKRDKAVAAQGEK
jgi:hypothetical protein